MTGKDDDTDACFQVIKVRVPPQENLHTLFLFFKAAEILVEEDGGGEQLGISKQDFSFIF